MFLTEFHRTNYTNSNEKLFQRTTDDPYPEQLDWRNKNAVTPVKNQVSIGHSHNYQFEHASNTAVSNINLVKCHDWN